MRKDFYIFRHGETDYNKQGRRQGQKIDAELNETGIAQAGELANGLVDLGIEMIYSSPLLRAKKTADIVGNRIGVAVEILEDLKEGCFGIFEGLLSSEIKEKYAKENKLWESMDEKDFDYALPLGESKREIAARMLRTLEGLLDEPYKKIAISTHGRITRLFLLTLGLNLEWMENGVFYHVVYEDGKWRVV